MAKKNQTPKYDISSELDIPEFDFDIPEPKDDRKPTTKVKDGVTRGAKSAFADTNFIRRLIRETLPPEYGAVDDLRIETTQGLKKLYNSAAQEVKPSLFEMSRAVNRLVPKENTKIKSALGKVQNWAKPDSKYGLRDDDIRRQREQNIALEIADVFNAQQQQQQQVETERLGKERAEGRIKEALDLGKHRDQIKLLSGINANTQSLVSYNNDVNIRAQRKSLEVQLKLYNLTADIHQKTIESTERITAELKLIAKNTALPEFVKLRQNEAWKEQLRNRFIGDMNAGLFGGRNNFVRGFFDRLSKQVKTKASEVGSAFSSAAFAADQFADSRETAKSFGIPEQSKVEMGAEFAGSVGAQQAAMRAGRWVNKKLSKNERFNKLTKDLNYGIRNIPQGLNKYANEMSFDDSTATSLLKSILRAGIGSMKPDTRIQQDSLLLSDPNSNVGLRAQVGFSNQNSKSINEIIPGYLARIYREIQVLRTGNTGIDLTTYDYTKNAFVDSTVANKRILDTLVGGSNKEAHNERIDRIFDLIDKDKTLDTNTRSKLAEFLTSSNINNKMLSKEFLSRRSTYSKQFDDAQARQITSLFSNYFGTSGVQTTVEGKSRRNMLNSELTSLGMDFSDPRALIQELINMGQYDRINDLGLIDQTTGRINLDKIVSYYNGNTKYSPQPNRVSGETVASLSGNKYGLTPGQNAADVIQAINDNAASTRSQLNEIVSQVSLDPVTSEISNTNEILQRIEKLITNNLRIVIQRERRNKVGTNFSGFGKFNYDMSGLKNGATSYYSAMQDKFSAGKEFAGNKIDELSEVLDEIEQEIGDTTGRLGIKDKARANFQKIKDYIQQKREGMSDLDTSTLLGSMRNIYRKTAGRVVGPMNRAIRRGYGMTKPLARAGFTTAATLGRVGLNLSRNVIDRVVDIRDVYVEGEQTPRILANKLRQGLYFDAITGAAIKRLHQIKGDVVDAEGNIVLSKDEIAKSYTRTSKGGIVGLAITLGKAGYNAVQHFGNTVFGNIIPNAVQTVVGLSKKVAVGFRNLFDQPVDMYVKDDLSTPVLLAVTMRAGGYYSKVTGNVVDRPSKIDGPIVDKDGNMVVTEAQLKKGLVDKDGKSVDGPYMKMLKLGAAGVRGAFNIARNVISGISGAIGKGIDFGGDFLNGFFDKFNRLLGGGKSYDVLVEIRNLLDARLPQKKKSSFFDKDGDGDRDGSVEDLMQSEKDREKRDTDLNKSGEASDFSSGRQNTIDRMMEGASSLKDKAMDFLGLGDGADIDVDTDGKGRRRRRKKGKLGKIASAGKALGKSGMARTLGSIGLKGLGIAGMGYGAYSAASNLADGNYGAAALDAGIAGAGAAATFGLGSTLSGLGAAGSAIAGGAATAGGLMAGLLSNPVGWAILGTAAAVGGGYMLYKYLTSPNMKPLSKMRMAQYGFATEEMDQIKKIQAFERYLLGFVKYDENGTAQLKIDDKAASGLHEFFGFDQDDRAMTARFAEWVQNRFKPVFLNSLSAIKSLNLKETISDIDNAEPEDKLKYLALAKMENGPYTVYESPFPEITKLTVGPKIVKYLTGEAQKAITEEAKTSGNKKQKTLEGTSALAGGAAALTGDEARDKLGINDDTLADKDGQIKDYSKMAKITKFVQESAKNMLNATVVGKTALAAVTMIGEKIGKFFGYRVDADEAVRFKTYGLIEMDSSKVVAIRGLEELIASKIEFKGDGSAVWNGVINDFLRDASYHFSIPDLTGPKAQSFVKWFSERFMPTYLNYRAWLKQASGQENQSQAEKALKAQDRYDIASKVAACQVWNKTSSPWDGYTLNTDPRSTRDNLVFLRDGAKDSKLVEAKKRDSITKDVTSAVNAPKPTEEVSKNLNKTVVAAKETIENAQQQAAANSDGEPKPTGGGSSVSSASTNVTGLTKASGDLKDGSGGDAFIEFRNKARLAGMHPNMLKLFKGMAEEYGELTGKKIFVNSGYRSYEEQAAQYKADPMKAAAPGRSLHEFGLAVDIDSKTADELESLGLMRKYGFTRPVGGEPWHLEMAGIQKNIDKAKKDGQFANEAISSSPGRGGGGWGTDKAAGKYSRNPTMAAKLFDSGDTGQNVGQREASGLPPAQINGGQADRAEGLMRSRSISGMLMGGGIKDTADKFGIQTPVGDSTTNNGGSNVGDSQGYNKVALPSGGKGYENVKHTIKDAAKLVGVDEKAMVTKAAVESSFRPGAQAGTSSATGLYQFTSGTWNEMMSKYASKYGIPPGTPPSDPRANAIMAAQYMKDNEGVIKKAKGSAPNDTDRYLAHFLGPTGASQILSANDNAIAADVRPKAAADPTHRNYFYHPDGRPKTVAEFKASIDKKLSSALVAHGIDTSQFSAPENVAIGTSRDSGLIQTNYVAPNVNNASSSESTANRVYDMRQRQNLVRAMTPATVTPVTQVTTPSVKPVTPGNQDKNSFFGVVTKFTESSLQIQNSQLEVLNKILEKMDPELFTKAMAKSMSEIVQANKQESAPATTEETKDRNGLVNPGKPPLSMKRMT